VDVDGVLVVVAGPVGEEQAEILRVAGVETTIHYRNASDAPIHELHVDVSMSVGKGCCDLHTVGPGDSGNRLVSLDATETPADQLEQATVEYRFQDAALRAWLVRNGEYHGPD
jgi:hypothetical protein